MRQRPDHRAKLKSIELSSRTQIRPCHILPSSFIECPTTHSGQSGGRPFSLLVFLVYCLFVSYFPQTNTSDISNSICPPEPIPTTLSFFMGRIHWGHNYVRPVGNIRNRRKLSFLFSLGCIQYQLGNECQGHWHQNTQWRQFAYVLACI